MKMRTRSASVALKWATFGGILFFLFLLQGIPGCLVIYGAAPNLLLAYSVCFALFHSEKEASIMGLSAGALMDLYSRRPFGFSAILFIAFCVAARLFISYLMKRNLGNAVLLCAGSAFLYSLFTFCFFDLMWGYSHLGARLLYDYLPSFVYTVLWTVPFYFLIRFLTAKFQRSLHGGGMRI